jgi:hypothetical protein
VVSLESSDAFAIAPGRETRNTGASWTVRHAVHAGMNAKRRQAVKPAASGVVCRTAYTRTLWLPAVSRPDAFTACHSLTGLSRACQA